MINFLEPRKALLDYGPIQMVIMASRQGIPMEQEIVRAGHHAINLLTELSEHLGVARKYVGNIKNEHYYPEILRSMIETARSTDEKKVTPMVAVAGTFSDLVADYLFEQGATKVMVNNGGDIAIRLNSGEATNVGLVPKIGASTFTHTFNIDSEDNIGGVATSGLGGRSFTLGVADSVTVFGQRCREADAAATLIANKVTVPHEGIKRVKAEELDPNTDIVGQMVTCEVPEFSKEQKIAALNNGKEFGKKLVDLGTIVGFVIFMQGEMIVYPCSLEAKVVNRSDNR